MNKTPDSELPVTDSNPADTAAPGEDAPAKPRRRRAVKVEPSDAEGQAAVAPEAEAEAAAPTRRRRKAASDAAPQLVTPSHTASGEESSPVAATSNEASLGEAFVAHEATPPAAEADAAGEDVPATASPGG